MKSRIQLLLLVWIGIILISGCARDYAKAPEDIAYASENITDALDDVRIAPESNTPVQNNQSNIAAEDSVLNVQVLDVAVTDVAIVNVDVADENIVSINESSVDENPSIDSAKDDATLRKPEWWKPKPGTSWQWQLEGTLNTKYDVDMYDVDLFDTPKETIDKLQKRGIKVVCYFSAGSYEEWRADSSEFPKATLGRTLEGWEDERWLDVSKIDLLTPIMAKRMDLASEKGCDGVEPDNVDGHQNENGFSLTYEDQLRYNKWLAEQAHARGLSIGLKNDLDQISDLVDTFDFAINEQCFEYDECDTLLQFTKENKAVFGVEYELETSEFCDKANSMNFDWLRMDYALDGKRTTCR